MARKRRSGKLPGKRSNRKKSDSDHSNGVSDENEVDNNQDYNSDEQQNTSGSSNDKTHKRFGKYRCLERRHSSSQDEDCEYNTNDLMPQEIQDIVLGDVKDVIISQDDIANDTCLQGDIEHEEVIEETIECESDEAVDCVDTIETSEISLRTGNNHLDLTTTSEPFLKSDLSQDFERAVKLSSSSLEVLSDKNEQEYIKEDNTIDYSTINGVNICNEIVEQSCSEEKTAEVDSERCNTDENKKNLEDRKKCGPDEPLRRSSRIRVNKLTDEEPVKLLNSQEVF